MTQINLNLDEKDLKILTEVLENYLSDLSMEITDTDNKEYRENLKSKRLAIQRILKTVEDHKTSS